MTHFESVFRSAHGKGLAADVIQWGALANVAQYRLPHEKLSPTFPPATTCSIGAVATGIFPIF
jgi:hypothetical protein